MAFRNKLIQAARAMAPDDQKLYVIRRDISGGVNSRQHGSTIGENQSESLTNVDLRVAGLAKKRKGTTLIEDLGNDAGTGALGFNPRGGTNEVIVTHGTKIEGWTGSGAFTEHDTGFTTGLQTAVVKATCSGGNGDVVIISNGTDNVHEMTQAHAVTDCGDTNTDCPLTTAITFYRNRLWALKDNVLCWSSALPATYDGAFDRATNNYNITVGDERAILGIRDAGLICIGENAIYGINPSTTPAATDKPEKILDIGCVASKSAVQVGDDVIFLAQDGVRGIFRTAQDKIQMGSSYPLSFLLKDEYDSLNWAYISKACAVYFDNMYLLAVPTGTSTYNNKVWVYFPASNSWSVYSGINVGAFAKVAFDGEEKLYYIDSNDGSVYQLFADTYTDNTAVIEYTEIGRKEDLGQPLVKKCGGEVCIKLVSTGDIDATVYAQFDDGGYQTLGSINATGNYLTFPLTFPVVFAPPTISFAKFHLDGYDEWYQIQLKIQNNVTGEDQDLQVLERSIVAYPVEYINEESA